MHVVRRTLSLAASLILATTVVSAVQLGTAQAATSSAALSGVRTDALQPGLVSAFGTWRGAPVGLAHEFLPYGTWTDIEGNSSFMSTWGASPFAAEMLWSVGMLPKDSTTTLEAGATGAYDDHWRTLAQHLVSAGMATAYIRPGWEMNGTWYRWSAAGHGTAYVDYFRHIVAAMRSVPGAAFRFVWSPNNGKDASAYYPGDGSVDVVGVDAYDQSWVTGYTDPATRWADIANGKYGLNYWATYAAGHGKPVALPEWGVYNRPDGHGGGDSPYYVEHMHDWVGAHDVAFETYFDRKASDGDHYLGPDATAFPKSAARYRALWALPVPTDATTSATATTTEPGATTDAGATTSEATTATQTVGGAVVPTATVRVKRAHRTRLASWHPAIGGKALRRFRPSREGYFRTAFVPRRWARVVSAASQTWSARTATVTAGTRVAAFNTK